MNLPLLFDTEPDSDCTWPTCLPEAEQDRLSVSIYASLIGNPDPHPYAGHPDLCPRTCTEKTRLNQQKPTPRDRP